MSQANEEEVQRTGKCAICGASYRNYGNNPEPIMPYERRVCDDCNMMSVVPARLGHHYKITTYTGEVLEG